MSVRHKTYPDSVKHGIPRLGGLKPGWQRFRFGDLLEEVLRPVQMDDQTEYDLVTVKRSRGGAVKRATLLGRDIAVKTQFRVEVNDFLISKRQIVHGACAVVPAALAGSIVSNEYAILRCRPDIDIGFLNYLSHSVYFQETCFHSSIGVHVEKMIFKLEDWFKWEIDIPVGREQQQIADFLSSMDQRLSVLCRKRDLLFDYKLGVIQQIFSQQIRFRQDNGAEHPEWQEKPLGKIADVVGGGTPDSGIPEYWNGDIAWFTPSEIKSKYLTDSVRHISSRGLAMSSARLLPVGSLILSSRATVGEVGIATQPCSTNQGFQSLVVHEPNDNEFLYYWVRANKRKILRRAAGSTFVEIGRSEMAKIPVLLPHPDEQQKISSFLSAVDRKIETVEKQITRTEAFKKGLIQQILV